MRIGPLWYDGSANNGNDRFRRLFAASLVVMGVGIVLPLEGSEDLVSQEVERTESALAERDEPKDGDFIIVPIPLVNPTLGYGLIGAAAYMKKLDPDSQASYIGGGGMYTDNGSWAAGFGGSFNLEADTWKFKGGLGFFDIQFPSTVLAMMPVTKTDPLT